MAGKLPKVTEYIKNVGKSVGYATIETVSEPTKNIREFVTTNEELFKTIYSATKNYKQTLKTIDRKIKQSQIYDAVTFGIKSAKEDLRTGMLYNKERERVTGISSMFGDDFADFGEFDMDDLDFGYDQNDDGVITEQERTLPIEVQAMSKTASGLSGIITANSRAQSKVILNSAELVIKSNTIGNKLLVAQNEKINSSIISGFAGVNAGLNMVNNIMSGPMTQFMNESTKFYGDVSNKLTETNAYLKEMTEMQRNLYKVQEQQWKTNAYDDIVGSSGMPDIMKYGKKIYKNIMDLDPTGGLMNEGEGNMMKMFLANPLKALPMMLAKVLIPTTVTKSMEALDKNMTGLFSSFIARMNDWAESDSSSLINIRGIIGSILGIKIDKKTKLDSSKYNRGPIPFDGETKKAIVDVIPAYLARIESAISGMPERVFDGKSGKFRTVADVQKEFRKRESSYIRSAGYSLEDDFETWARNKVERNTDLKDNKARDNEYRRLRRSYDNMIKQIWEDGGSFTPYEGFGPDGKRKTGGKNRYKGEMTDKEYLELIGLFNTLENRHKIWQVAGNTIDAKMSFKRYLEGQEGQFMNAFNRLFDGSQMGYDENGKLITLDPRKNNLFSSATSGYNATNKYLKDILAEVRYIRMYGLTGGRGKGKYKSTGPKPSFDDFANKEGFVDHSDEEAFAEEERSMYWYPQDKARAEAEREKSMAEKYGLTVKNLKEMESAKTIMDKWKALRKSVDNLLKSPAQMITKVINTADKRFFEAMFGSEDGEKFKDKYGFEYQGFLDYVVGRTSRIFDEFENKMKEGFKNLWEKFKGTRVGGWIAEKGGAFAKSVGGHLRDKAGWAKNRGKQAWNNTFGRLINKIRRGGVVTAEEFEAARRAQPETYSDEYMGSDYGNVFGASGEPDSADLWDQIAQDQMDTSAYGRIVTKYGLSMLSPGEIVIPNPTGRGRDLINEKKEKSKIMRAIRGGHIGHNANGTQNQNTKEESKITSTIKKIIKEVGGDGADIVADSLIGGGVSLITGMIGGPLLGAAAGAAFGLTKHSDTVRKFMFGENEEGGAIPKSVIDFFKKHSDGMIDFGVAGGIAGLFTPLGLVGGALAGATLGFTKDTEWFKETMFGNEEKGKTGLMSKETFDKLKKAFPAMGIGAGVAALTGPFGLVGNAVLGSAAGYLVTSDKFQEAILGAKGADGKRHGGLAGQLKAGLVEPLKDIVLGKEKDGKREGGMLGEVRDFIKNDIIGNTQKVFEAAGQFVRNEFLSIGDRIQDAISGVFKEHVGMPIEEYLREKVFKRITGLIGGIVKGAFGAAKFVVGTPFRAAGYLADSVMMAQMGRGTLDTKNAQERLDLRNRNKVRAARMRMSGRDKTYELDQALAGMNVDQLTAFNSNIETFIKNRGTKNLAYHDMLESTGSSISNYMTSNGLWDNNKGYNLKKKILNLLQEGKLNDVEIEKLRKKHNLTNEQMSAIINLIDREGIASARQGMIDESGLDEEAINAIQRATGYTNLGKAGNRYFRQMLRLGKTELRFRNRKKGDATVSETEAAEAEESSPIVRNTNSIINILRTINNNIIRANGGIGDTVDDKGNVETANEDSKEAQDAKREQEEEKKTQSGILSNLSMLTTGLKEFFGFKSKPKEDKKEGIVSKVLGWIGDNKSALGKVALTLGGVSLFGYGTEFLKNNFWPAFKETGLYKKLDSVLESTKDGTLFINLANKIGSAISGIVKNVVAPLTQGVIEYLPKAVTTLATFIPQGIAYAVKNVGIPLVGALFKSLPQILWGLVKGTVKGIGALFGIGGKSSSSDTISTGDYLSEAQKAMPIGKDEAAIAANFSTGSYNTSATQFNISFDNIAPATGSGGETTTEFDPASLNRDDSSVGTRGAINAFKRGLATGNVPTIANKIGNIGRKLISNKSIGKSASKVITSKTLLGKAISATNTSMKLGGRFITESTEKAAQLGAGIKNFFTKGTVINAAKAVADNSNSSFISGIAKKVETFFEWLGGTKFATGALNFLGKSTTKLKNTTMKPLFKKLGQKLGQMIAAGGASKLAGVAGTKIVKALGNTTPLAIAFWLDSFIEGAVTKTETILGVTKDSSLDITTGMRFVVGMLNAINENLLLGLIDTGTILDTLVDIFGGFLGIDKDELRAAQEETDKVLKEAGLNGEDVSLAEYNNQQGFFSKLKNLFTGSKAKSSETTSTTSTSGTGRVVNTYGRGRGGQQGGIYANMRYGNSTIGQAGCAPVAAASMLGGNIPEAAKYAQLTGHVGADGSTDIGFFGDYFSAKGISNRTTTSKNDVSKALDNGQSAVLLGRDPNGGYDSAYSDSSHYITARKGANGNYIVNDPALGVRSMSKNKVLKNMHASVITGRGRRLAGRGNDNTIGGTIYNTSSATTNAQKIVNTALAEVGTKESGDNLNKYGAEYGTNGVAWCCIFVWWVFKHAGASSLFYGGNKCASCTTLMNWYKQKGQAVSDIKPGDLLFFNFDSNPNRSKAQHIGICVTYSGGDNVVSVEGNTSSGNSGSQDNGGGVYKRTRKLSQIICVVRPAYAGATFDTAIPSNTYYNYETGEETSSAGGFFNSLLELGKSMVKAMFGEGLYNAVFGEDTDSTSTGVDPNVDADGNLVGSTESEKAWKYLRSLGYSKEGTAAIMSSLYHESGLKPNNLQNTYERKLGSDSEYTNKINAGTYSKDKFSKDSGGYGLAQWTYSTRKAGLYDATIAKGKPINSMKDQLDYMHKEIQDYGLDSALKNATNISDANNLFVSQYEKPAGSENKGSSVYTTRLKTAQDYYNTYKGTGRRSSMFNKAYSGGAREDGPTVTAGAGTVSYTVFLETIVTLLMSVSDNTAALNKILEILSDKFDIKLSTNEVNRINNSSSTADQAKDAINKLMANRTNAADVANILQSKNTNYLVEVMTSIARE